MKGSFKLAERQQAVKEAEAWVKPQLCMICKKSIPGAYGAWAAGWSCSKQCEGEYRDSLSRKTAG